VEKEIIVPLQQSPFRKSLLPEKYNTAELGPIFIVDDSEDDQHFLGHEIKALFGEAPIMVFKNGMRLVDYLYEAIRLGRTHGGQTEIPRLILMDLYMPGMDGLSALQILRKDLRMLDVPVIILSGTKDIREIERTYEFGATAFLPKPFSRQEFIQAIHHNAGLAHIN
jgi:CheY-like chemotaxis protein